jgi:RNA polymerase sigma factor (sigma-70 family)
MSGRGPGILTRDLDVLFGVGTSAGLTDAQLLERFTQNRDDGAQAAFAALVARHGPMVLRVCGATLQNLTDIEDAFQATFLILARKARSIQEPGSVGSWLFGVARRTAANARLSAIRRRRHEQNWAALTTRPPADEDRNHLDSDLWDEVNRLPEKYRAPVVLCYLEGLTHDEAARQLGWPVGTVEGRLARARGLLRARLARRGLAPGIGLLIAPSHAEVAPTVVSAVLTESTASAAIFFAAGRTPAMDSLSSRATALAERALANPCLIAIKTAVAAIMMVVLIMVGAGRSKPTPPTPQPLAQPKKGKANAAPAAVKHLHVLFLMGEQFTWEYRFIARALAEGPEIRMSAILMREPARDGKGQLEDNELKPGRYDVYVLSDLPADALTLQQQGMLATAVERGAGMIMLGGHSSFGSGGWAQTEVARILPIEIRPGDGVKKPANRVKLGLELTDAGLKSWILKFGSAGADTIKIWSKLPPFSEVNRLGPPRTSALILARTDDGEPLLVVQAVGNGRVLAFAGETWMWARASDDGRSIHRMFWRRALFWAGQFDAPPE